jgi:hypothetical protein
VRTSQEGAYTSLGGLAYYTPKLHKYTHTHKTKSYTQDKMMQSKYTVNMR